MACSGGPPSDALVHGGGALHRRARRRPPRASSGRIVPVVSQRVSTRQHWREMAGSSIGFPICDNDELSSLELLVSAAADCVEKLASGNSLDHVRAARQERTRAAMTVFSGSAAQEVFQPRSPGVSLDASRAAIVIQSWYRGHVARKEYVRRLYKQFQQDEAQRAARARQQVQDGELLVENYMMDVDRVDRETTARCEQRRINSAAHTVQRTWRAYRYRRCSDSTAS